MSSKAKKPAAAKKSSAATKTAKKTAGGSEPADGLRERLAGTWELISAEDKDPTTGKWKKYTFGNPPAGYFVYDATGHASIQIMTTPPVQLAKADSPTPAEALEIFNGYIAYFGTYTVDEQNISVTVVGAWDPSQVGTVQARPYELKGDTLIIGDQTTYKRTLRRFR